MSEILSRLLESAGQDLQSATAGSSLCRLTVSGSPGTSVKRAEGQWAALRELSGKSHDNSGDLVGPARQLLVKWNDDLTRWSDDPRSSWVPYCQGGVGALERFIELSQE